VVVAWLAAREQPAIAAVEASRAQNITGYPPGRRRAFPSLRRRSAEGQSSASIRTVWPPAPLEMVHATANSDLSLKKVLQDGAVSRLGGLLVCGRWTTTCSQ
jgi:hypothetical protein